MSKLDNAVSRYFVIIDIIYRGCFRKVHVDDATIADSLVLVYGILEPGLRHICTRLDNTFLTDLAIG